MIDGFAGCTALTDISMPETVTAVGDEAFFGCAALEELVFPDSLQHIGEFAFCGCTALEKITLGRKVCVIGRSAFTDCLNLIDVWYNGSEEDARDSGILYHADLMDRTWHFAK